MKNKSTIIFSVMFVFATTFSVVHAQTWVAPTGIPPYDNTPTPVNVGSFGQTKNGFFSALGGIFGNYRLAAKEIRATRFCLQPESDFNSLDGGLLRNWAVGSFSALGDTNCVDALNPWGSGNSNYTPQGPTSITAGGITAGTNLGLTPITLQSLIDKLLYPYAGPSIVLTAVPANHIFEKGNSVGVSLTATATLHSNPITNVTILKNGSSINSTALPSLTYGETIISNANTNTVTYQATATDSAAGNGPTTVNSNSIVYTFVYPMFGGVGPAGMSGSSIVSAVGTTMQKFVQAQGDVAVQSSPVAIQPPGSSALPDGYYYFAYPASYGPLQSIRDNNNFETKGDYNLRTVTITIAGTPVTYNVYEFNHSTTQVNFTNTYKF